MSDMVLVGIVGGVRGIKGELRIKAFTDQPTALFDYGPLFSEDGSRTYRGKVTGQPSTGKTRGKGGQGEQVLVQFEGINDRNQAEALKGHKLFVPRDSFPEPDEDEYYHTDLIGLKAELPDGSRLGVIRWVLDVGAGVSLDITTETGPVLVPFTKAAVPMVNLAEGRVIIDPPDGVLDPPDPETSQEQEV